MEPMKSTKQHLFDYCQRQVEERISRIQGAMVDAQEASNNDTKSSAGDKYETGRAMMQLELDKNRTQLKEAKGLQQVLSNINPEKTHETVQLGSLASTSMGNLYISVSLGRALIEGESYIFISPASPIGKALLGKKATESAVFNGKTIEIHDVN